MGKTNIDFFSETNKNLKTSALLILLVVFFISDDTVTFGTNNNQLFIVVKYFIYVFCSAILFLSLNFGEKVLVLSFKEIGIIFLLIFTFLFTIIFNFDFRTGYFLQLLTLLFSILIVKFVDFDLFIKYFSLILYKLSIISLVVLIIALTIPNILAPFPTTVNFGGVTFKNLIICAVFTETSFLRNTSIFREPGVYVIYLLLGIIIEFFYNTNVNKKYLSLFIISLISTLSTSGIFILLILLIGYMLKVNKTKIYVRVIMFLLICGGSLIVLPDFSSLLFSKMDADSSDYVSTLARLSSFSVPFFIFLNNPIFGVGLSNFVRLYSVYSVELFGIFIDPESSSTNTIINTFAIFGFVYGILMLFSFFKISRRIVKISRWAKIIVFISFLMMFSTQEMRYSLFLNVLIMYGLLSENLKREVEQ
jgi:hypothetical protein